MTWEEMLIEYKRFVSRKSENTAYAYIRSMEQWGFTAPPTLATINSKLDEWYNQGLKGTTIKRHLCALKFLFKTLRKEFDAELVADVSAIAGDVTVKKPLMGFVSQEITEEIISQTDHRTAAIIGLLFYEGLRISEAVSLDLDNVKPGFLEIIDPKNKESVRIPYTTPKVKALLNDYIKSSRPIYQRSVMFKQLEDSRKALFLSNRGRVSVDFAKVKVKAACVAAGYPDLHCHAFRHGTGTLLHRKGVDMFDIKEMLRHKSIQTTARYVTGDFEELKGKVSVFD